MDIDISLKFILLEIFRTSKYLGKAKKFGTNKYSKYKAR